VCVLSLNGRGALATAVAGSRDVGAPVPRPWGGYRKSIAARAFSAKHTRLMSDGSNVMPAALRQVAGMQASFLGRQEQGNPAAYLKCGRYILLFVHIVPGSPSWTACCCRM
jgi:hypothetical protein